MGKTWAGYYESLKAWMRVFETFQETTVGIQTICNDLMAKALQESGNCPMSQFTKKWQKSMSEVQSNRSKQFGDADNSATASQKAVIKTSGQEIHALIKLGNGYVVNTRILEDVSKILNDSNPNNDKTACGLLDLLYGLPLFNWPSFLTTVHQTFFNYNYFVDGVMFAPLEKVFRQVDGKTITHSSKPRNKEDQQSFGSPSFGNHHLQRSIDPSFNFGNVSIYDKIQHKENTCPCGGGCPGCMQAKLKVSQPGDMYEQEADRIADQVIRMPDDTINRKCTSCEKEDEMKIHRKSDSSSNLEISDDVANVISGIRGGGSPLDDSTRKFMESRFGFDFGRVRIHTDGRAARSAESVNALAYTIEDNIVFGDGKFKPNTIEGTKLLAHELTHVIQQKTMHSFGHFIKIHDQRMPMIQRQAGWSDAQGWNKQVEKVYQSGTTTAPPGAISVSRIPLENLIGGNQNESVTTGTKEKAAGKAIVIVPDSINPANPVEILLHLHGHNVGYRQVGKSVRDIALDRIEQQMVGSGRSQLVAILPQGTIGSEFGNKGFTKQYIDQVLGRVASIKAWPRVPTFDKDVEQYVLSGHSGAGFPISQMISGKTTLPDNNKMRELVLFEAINGPQELQDVKNWAEKQIQGDVDHLKILGSIDQQNKYLTTSMRFRGYYTPNGSYTVRYRDLEKWIQDKFTGIIDPAGLDASIAKSLKDHYKVIVTTDPKTWHDNIMGEGDQLKDALDNLPALP